MSDRSEYKMSFLLSAINDTQDIIRFIDAKVTVVTTIIGGYCVASLTTVDSIVKYHYSYSTFFWIIISLYLLSEVMCVLVIASILKPINNPVKNIKIANDDPPKIDFYLGKNLYYGSKIIKMFVNNKNNHLSISLKDYMRKLDQCDEPEILKSLSMELLKLSYIRNVKNDRFAYLVWLLAIVTAMFIIAYMFYVIETQNAINLIDNIKHFRCGA